MANRRNHLRIIEGGNEVDDWSTDPLERRQKLLQKIKTRQQMIKQGSLLPPEMVEEAPPVEPTQPEPRNGKPEPPAA